MTRRVTLAHSPDADDAFMFYAIAKGKIDTQGMEFRHELHDIQTLNGRAVDGVYDVTAVSFAAYPAIRAKYRLLNCGASVGDGYGPVVVSKRPLTPQDLEDVTVAVPGEWTTAFLVLRLFAKPSRHRVLPFDEIMSQVAGGHVDAGLLIHEGQLTFGDFKLHRIADLGEWWKLETGLPLPLGGNAIRKEIDDGTSKRIADVLRASIRYALEHREEALEYALGFGRGLDHDRGSRFVGMYVNDHTLDLGESGRSAVQALFRYGFDAGYLPERVTAEYIG